MKKSDMEGMYQITEKFSRLGKCLPSGPQRSFETRTYEALLDLMDLAGRTTEIGGSTALAEKSDYELYTGVSGLDAELNRWYNTLPEQLRWTPENIQTAPFGFFLLHQQYHCAMILLHRPFTLYPSSEASATSKIPHERNDTLLSTLSRQVCTTHAIQVAHIFAEHKKKFETRTLFGSCIHHAGTASTSLIAALLHSTDQEERKEYLQHLECLATAMSDMASTYKSAEAVSDVLKAVMIELRQPLATSPNDKTSPMSISHKSYDGVGSFAGLPSNSPPIFVGEQNYPEDISFVEKIMNYSTDTYHTGVTDPYESFYGYMGPELTFSAC
jgi:hypothetical protein